MPRRKKTDLRLEVDRFFMDVRKNVTENAFQHVKRAQLDILRKSDVPFVYTTEPKRNFIVKDKVVEKGFKVYFNFQSVDNYEKFKEFLFGRFQDEFFLKFNYYSNTTANKKSGYVKITNMKTNKEEK
jgi:hypothetical protein